MVIFFVRCTNYFLFSLTTQILCSSDFIYLKDDCQDKFHIENIFQVRESEKKIRASTSSKTCSFNFSKSFLPFQQVNNYLPIKCLPLLSKLDCGKPDQKIMHSVYFYGHINRHLKNIFISIYMKSHFVTYLDDSQTNSRLTRLPASDMVYK